MSNFGPVHQAGTFNIEALIGGRWRTVMNRRTQKAAITAAKERYGETDFPHRVFDPFGELVFDSDAVGSGKVTNITFNIAAERAITHERLDVGVIGEQHGPFAVHLCPFALERTWVVTHVSTGRKVASGPTRHSARHAAALLQQLDVDWSFTDVASARAIPQEIQAQIQVIRVACAAGGEA